MVAPSAFSKDSSTEPSEPIYPEASQKGQRRKTTVVVAGSSSYKASTSNTNISPSTLIPTTAFPERKSKVKSIAQGIIMNPVVLSMISHFPNKCIPNKSQKYVINSVSASTTTLTSQTSEKSEHSQKLELNNNSKNSVNSNQSNSNSRKKGRPSTKLKRYAGLLLAILSSMMFSFTGLIVKIINHHHPLTQATWMFIATAIVALPVNLIRYIYVYKVNSRLKEEDERRLDRKLSDCFKACPNTIEPVKLADSLGQSEKLTMQVDKISQIEKSEITSGTVGISILQKKVLSKEDEERRQKIKLFLLLLVRACSGCSGMILYFYSLKYLNVGDSLVIVCSSPIFVFIIGYLFLGENCGVIPVITIILSMVGVGVITRPPMLTGKETFRAEDMIGAGLAFSSMLCIAMTIILMRFLQNVYHGLINLVFAIWGSIQTTSLALAVGVLECPRNAQDAVLMGTTGVLFFLGQTFLAVALQFEEAGPVSLVRTSEVVFAFVWQFIFLNIAPDLFSISGAGLILAGILLTICRKWVAAMPEDSKSRKMFSFLLR